MTLRAVLLAALAFFLFAEFSSAEADPVLPSRKPDTVLPLLRQFSAKDGYNRITQILGKEDSDIGSAYRECVFRLEGASTIMVKASPDGKRVYFIHHGNDVLYREPFSN